MDIPEINTRGPEIFPMKETVRGVRHKKKLVGVGSAAATSLLGVAGALLILLCSVVPPRLDGEGGKGGPGKKPPSPARTPAVVVTVSPSPVPEESPTPEPEESPTPEPTEEPSPTPEPSEEPSPTPEPSTAPINPPYNPPATPTPSSKPTISFSGVFYESLNHAALTCKVTANQAADLSTTVEASSSGGEPLGGTTYGGEGSFNLNTVVEDIDTIKKAWSVSGSMSYALNGVSKEDSISKSVKPSTTIAKLSETSRSATPGVDNLMVVNEEFTFSYSGDKIHDYDVRVTGIDIGWMKKSGSNYTTAGNIHTLWKEEYGDSPVTSVKDSSSKKITFTYQDSLQPEEYLPPSDAARATHFYLVFYLDGTGTDTNTSDYEHADDAVYDLKKPKRLICEPFSTGVELPEASPPSFSVDDLYCWSMLGEPSYGLKAFALKFSALSNEEDSGSMSYTIKLSPQSGSGSSFTQSGTDAAVGVYWARSTGGAAFINSSHKKWVPTVTLKYSVDGVSKQKNLSFDPIEATNFMPTYVVTYDSDGTATAAFTKDSGDPMVYSGTAVTKVTVHWLKNSSETGSAQLWPGSGLELVQTAGGDDEEEQRVYTLSGFESALSPPSGTTKYYLTFDTNGYTGTLPDEEIVIGTRSFSSSASVVTVGDQRDVPGAATGDYLGPGKATGIEGSMIRADGFFARFPIDKSIVPDASDSTISPVSVKLTLPNGSVRDLLDPACSTEYYVDTDDSGDPIFIFRYEPEDDPFPTGDYTLNVTLSYTSGSVTDLRSANSCSFTVMADHGYSLMDPETWVNGDPAVGDTRIDVFTQLDAYYDESDYTYTATVTSAQIVWTVDGTEQTPVALTPPEMNDDGEGWITTEEISFDVALPTGGEAWSYELQFTVKVSGSNGTDSFSDTVTVTSNRVAVAKPSSGSLTVDAYFRTDGSGELSVFNMDGLPSTLAIDAEIWIDIEELDVDDLYDVEISVTDASIVWTVDGAEQTEAVSVSASLFGFDTDYGSITGTVTGSVSVPAGATHAKLLCGVSAEFEGRTGSDTAESETYELGSSSDPFDIYVNDPETRFDPPGDVLTVYTTLGASYEPVSGYTFSASVTAANIVWTVDGTAQAPVALAPMPSMGDGGEGWLTTDEISFNVALPESGRIWKYKLTFTVVVSASNGINTHSETFNVTSNEVTVKEDLSGPDHAFSSSATIISPFIGSSEFSANGAISIRYNTDTEFDYTAQVTAVEISFNGGAYAAIPAANWDILNYDDSDPGFISIDYRIHGYSVPGGMGGSCVVRFTVQISGSHGTETYSTTLNPETPSTGVGIGT